jgi:hypothetical protein
MIPSIKNKSGWDAIASRSLLNYIAMRLPGIPSSLRNKAATSLTQAVTGQAIGTEFNIVDTLAQSNTFCWTPYHFATVSQDSANTIPVTDVGQTIGAINPIIGSDLLTQDTTSFKPTSTSYGIYFDGVDDNIGNPMLILPLINRSIILIFQTTDPSRNNGIFGLQSASSPKYDGYYPDSLILFGSGSLYLFGSTLTYELIEDGINVTAIYSEIKQAGLGVVSVNSLSPISTNNFTEFSPNSGGGLTLGFTNWVNNLYYGNIYLRAVYYAGRTLSGIQQKQVERFLGFFTDSGVY